MRICGGDQVAPLFAAGAVHESTGDKILKAAPPAPSRFAGIDFGEVIPALASGGDPWRETVAICRASFALSFALVPESVAAVDDQTTEVSAEQIVKDAAICGEDRFWNISRAIMHDAVVSIAMFWQDVWVDFSGGGKA